MESTIKILVELLKDAIRNEERQRDRRERAEDSERTLKHKNERLQKEVTRLTTLENSN